MNAATPIQSSGRPTAARATEPMPHPAAMPAAKRNPFPGPQPYRDADHTLFFGRDDDALRFERHLLASPCTTLFGPSGSGKSSLIQAAVVPHLVDKLHYQVARVESWLTSENPLRRFVRVLCAAVGRTAPEASADPRAAIDDVIARASIARRPLLIFLDQMEQLLYTSRDPAQFEALLEAVDQIVQSPSQDLHVVLALREDYLGRFRDRARTFRMLLESGFRLGPLSVAAMTKAVCQAAAQGQPPQTWDPDEVRELLLEVRAPGQPVTLDAEVQAAFAQIACRAQWEEAYEQGATTAHLSARSADAILRHHLATTLAALGLHADAARELLEDKLVDERGHRMLLTEGAAIAALPADAAREVLETLEFAAVLHAESYDEGRYFSLGHDCLAAHLFEQRNARLAQEAERRKRLQDEQRRARRRRLRAAMSSVAATVIVALSVLSAVALRQRGRANAALGLAEHARERARTASMMAGARELLMRDETAAAANLLAEVRDPASAPGWMDLALETLWSEIPIVTLAGHGSPVTRVEVSWDDAQRVLTVFREGAPRLWKLDGSGRSVPLTGHQRAVRHAAFSRDGTRIVTSSWDRTTRVWRADTASEIAQFKHRTATRSAEISPDNVHVVTISEDNIARVWNTDAPDAPPVLLRHAPRKHVTSAAFSPDGRRIVTASDDGQVLLWELATPDAPGRPIQSSRAAVYSARFDGKGARIITASADRVVRVFQVDSPPAPAESVTAAPETPTEIPAAAPEAPAEIARDDIDASDAMFSPDGTYILLLLRAGRDALLQSSDGTQRQHRLSGHADRITSMGFSPDGELVATASLDGTTRLWSVRHATCLAVLRSAAGAVNSAAFSRDGTRLVAGSFGDSHVWGVQGWRRPQLLAGHGDRIDFAEFSPDGQYVVTASEDGTARVWNSDGSGQFVTLIDHDRAVVSARFSKQDGTRIVTASNDGTVRLWRTDAPNQPLTLVPQGPYNLTFADLSPDGTRVVVTSTEPAAEVWTADGTRKKLLTLQGHRDTVRTAAFSPDGTQIVTASDDGVVRIFDANGDGKPREIGRHDDGVRSAFFSPDGRRVVTASADATVRVWSVDRSAPPVVLRGHAATVSSAVFSRDGTRIVSAALDGTARIWNADGSTRPLVIKVRGSSRDVMNHVLSAGFDRDATRVVTSSSNGIAQIWDVSALDVPMLKKTLERATDDCLSADLRRAYLGEDSDAGFQDCERRHGQEAD